uniref:Uncharacterized protein n=1 Tax=viral metagenome TaxID=1070528 RepID=A0A6M3JXX2_9ZZZZ
MAETKEREETMDKNYRRTRHCHMCNEFTEHEWVARTLLPTRRNPIFKDHTVQRLCDVLTCLKCEAKAEMSARSQDSPAK